MPATDAPDIDIDIDTLLRYTTPHSSVAGPVDRRLTAGAWVGVALLGITLACSSRLASAFGASKPKPDFFIVGWDQLKALTVGPWSMPHQRVAFAAFGLAILTAAATRGFTHAAVAGNVAAFAVLIAGFVLVLPAVAVLLVVLANLALWILAIVAAVVALVIGIGALLFAASTTSAS